MPTVLTADDFNDMLKRFYTDERIDELLFADSPMWAVVKRDFAAELAAAKPEQVQLTWWSLIFAWLAWLVAVHQTSDAMSRRQFFRELLPAALDAAKGKEVEA